MFYDPAWDMPRENWEPQSPFLVPQTPPAVRPDAGTPVCIGPVAQEWIDWLVGAVDAGKVPASWTVANDAQQYQVQSDVDTLKGLIATARCLPMETRFDAATCTLQTSADGGITWVDVPGWSAGFGDCVRLNVPPVPVPLPGETVNQMTCNIAGYLARELLLQGVKHARDQYAISPDATAFLEFMTGFLSEIGFVWTGQFLSSVPVLLGQMAAISQADADAAAADPLMQGTITCCIYNAIRTAGGINHTTFADILVCICGVASPYPAAMTVICNWLTSMGSNGIGGFTASAALIDEDCTACGTWCRHQDLTSTDGGWTIGSAPFNKGVWVGGSGWNSTVAGTEQELVLILSLGAPFVIDSACFWMVSPTGNTSGNARFCQYLLGGVSQRIQDFKDVAYPTVTELCANTDLAGGAVTADEIVFVWLSDGITDIDVLSQFRLYGHSTAPTLGDDCT